MQDDPPRRNSPDGGHPGGTGAAAQGHGRPPDPERERELARLDRLAHLLDARFRLPGTGIRFGLDGLLGLIPGVGDVATTAPSAWMIVRGWQLGARRRVLVRMAGNTAIDFVVGSIPLVGDLFDVGFKANLRNAALLRGELLRPPRGGPSPGAGAMPPPQPVSRRR